MDRKSLEISWVTLWRVLFFVALVAVMYAGLRVLLGLFLALVISSGLEFMVNFLEKRGMPRPLGVIIIFLLFVLLLVLIIYAIIPLTIIDLNSTVTTFSKMADRSWWGPFLNFKAAESATAFINRISSSLFADDASPLSAVSNIIGGLALTVSILVSSFYLSLYRDGVERFVKAVMPPDYEDMALRIYDRSRRKVGYWFRSQILLSLTMGVLVLASLLILGVKYALLLAILAAVFELVPFIGPILAGAAAVLAAFTTSPALALYTLIVFVVLQQIESHILIPLLIGRSVGLHPVIVIIALLMGAEVGGFLGILISVPAAVVFQEIVEEWSNKKRPRQAVLV